MPSFGMRLRAAFLNVGSACAVSAILRITSDGWTSRLDEDFTEENVVRLVDALADIWSQAAPGAIVYVGFDARPEAERFACLVGRVLAGRGLAAMVSDRFCPLPALAWICAEDQRACGGVMVTGSSNPSEYLGVKIYTADGSVIPPEMAAQVEARIEGEPSGVRGAIERKDLVTSYLGHLTELVDKEAIAASGLDVVFDALYGSARGYLPSVLEALGVSVREIHGEPDDEVEDIHPKAAEPWVDACEGVVVEAGAAAGLVSDGDGMRSAAVDDTGRFVSAHQINALVLRHLVEHRGAAGRVVLDVSASMLARRVAKRAGHRVTVRPIGFEHMAKELHKGDVLVGIEGSGGIALGGYMYERDGLAALLIVLEMMAQSGKTLSRLVDELGEEVGTTSYARRDLRVEPGQIEMFRMMLPGLNPQSVAGKTPVAVSHMDGLRLEFEDESWVLMRPSRTRSIVRVYAEAATVQKRDSLLEAACAIARGEV